MMSMQCIYGAINKTQKTFRAIDHNMVSMRSNFSAINNKMGKHYQSVTLQLKTKLAKKIVFCTSIQHGLIDVIA